VCKIFDFAVNILHPRIPPMHVLRALDAFTLLVWRRREGGIVLAAKD